MLAVTRLGAMTALAATLLAGGLRAADSEPSTAAARAAEHPWYAGVEVGRSDVYNRIFCVDSPCPGPTEDRGHSHAWGVNAGYRFNAYIALEYGYRRTFDASLALEPRVSTHDVSLLAYTPEFRRVSAFARVGASRMHDDSGAPFVLPVRSSTKAHYGIGASLRAGDRIELRVERVDYARSYFSRGRMFRVGIDYAF